MSVFESAAIKQVVHQNFRAFEIIYMATQLIIEVLVIKGEIMKLQRKNNHLTYQNQILQDQNNRVQFEFSQNLQKLEETRLNVTNLIAERSTLQATLENARQQFSILKSELDEQKKKNTIQQCKIKKY